ncbi:OsmC family protein [Nakamurella leprariae]|uniref:OsmC family protein n=1 Tax=Nakamurella leprariae TaxID=2803911 RepID=A0A938YDH2_9ACTN|nr:OsmC family protein [Nakamurella leprariae]MBM9467571.1 OsmC family protein [Nakamurella leprariae]
MTTDEPDVRPARAPRVHRFTSALRWSGSTAGGYRDYSRAHHVTLPPTDTRLTVTADAAFRGDAALPNPEQLLLAAAASCQLLSFLALAAVAGVDVLSYSDEAEAEMPVTREAMRITRIVLRPHIEVAEGTDTERVVAMVHQGHDECFIANTLNAEVVVEPTVQFPIAFR